MKNKLEFKKAIQHSDKFPYVNIIKRHRLIGKICWSVKTQSLCVYFNERYEELSHEDINEINWKMDVLEGTRK